MPLLAIATFSLVATLPRVPLAVYGLVILQIILDAVLWQHPKLLWNDGDGTSALLSYFDGSTGRLTTYFPSFTALDASNVMKIGWITLLWFGFTAWLVRRAADSVCRQRL